MKKKRDRAGLLVCRLCSLRVKPGRGTRWRRNGVVSAAGGQ